MANITEQNYGVDSKRELRAQNYLDKAEARKHASSHIAAFVLGIISILTCLFWYLAIPCGVLAIVFGAKSARALASRLGKAGLIMGIVGVSLTVFIYLSIVMSSLAYYYF